MIKVERKIIRGDELISAAQRPDENIEAAREMEQRGRIWRRNAGSGADRIDFKFSFCVLQRPWLVLDLASIDVVAVGGVEAVALGEPVFDGAFFAGLRRSGGAIASAKFYGGSMAARGVMNGSVAIGGSHGRMKVWQVVESACGPDGWKIGGVEAEKVDAGLVAVSHVGADI